MHDTLQSELKEKDSELEDLGCWRRILIRKKPVKKLTEVMSGITMSSYFIA